VISVPEVPQIPLTLAPVRICVHEEPSNLKTDPPSTAYRSVLEAAQRAPKPAARVVVVLDQEVPSKCSRIPALVDPTVNTSELENPKTACRWAVVPLAICAQTDPLYRRIVLFMPTANASVGDAAQTPHRSFMDWTDGLHDDPLNCTTVPPMPTANALAGADAETARRCAEVPLELGDQLDPS
jgi:hypothetical protein